MPSPAVPAPAEPARLRRLSETAPPALPPISPPPPVPQSPWIAQADWASTELQVDATHLSDSLPKFNSSCDPAAVCKSCGDGEFDPNGCSCTNAVNVLCTRLYSYWGIDQLPAFIEFDFQRTTSIRRLTMRPYLSGLVEQRLKTFLIQCTDDPAGYSNRSWHNASGIQGGAGIVTSNDELASSITLDVTCDARFWRVWLLERLGTDVQQPAAILKRLEFFGVPTPSPPPPPPPPLDPPLAPPTEVWAPDYEALERERLQCVQREFFRMARERARQRGVLSELPQTSTCSWSAADALVANTTVYSLQPLRAALQAPATLREHSQPAEPLRNLVTMLMRTQHYGPLVAHWFDRSYHEIALGIETDSRMLGRWDQWRRDRCASSSDDPQTDGYGYRYYVSRLMGLPLPGWGVDWTDACFHYMNLPVVFDRVMPLFRCRRYIDGVDGMWGRIRVYDPSCGACRTREPSCMEGGVATSSMFVGGQMARDVDLDALDAAGNFSSSSSSYFEVPRSRRSRSELRFGWPMANKERCAFDDCRQEQEEELRNWVEGVLGPNLRRLGAKYSGTIRLYSEMEQLQAAGMRDVLRNDILLSVLPLPIGFIYLLLYTGSVFLALAGALQLAVAWPTAFFLYRYWFDLRHIETITLLAAPLTASFSLDAMALLIDGWHMSAQQPASVLQTLAWRMDWVLLDAGFACFHSIAVGVAALAAAGTSPWLVVAHFGIYCALELTVQLLLAILLLPACMVLFHDHLERKPNVCCVCCCRRDMPIWTAVTAAWRPLEQTSTAHHHATRMIEATLPGVSQEEPVKGSFMWPLPRFLGRVALPLVRHRKGRRALLGVFGVLMVPVFVGLAFAVPATRPRGRLYEWHPLRHCRVTTERSFLTSAHEQTVRGTLLWGVEGVDRRGVHLLRNSSFVGHPVWKEGFAFDEETQLLLERTCDALRVKPWVRRDPERPFWQGSGSVQCFVDDFKSWLSNSSGRETHGFGPRFPVAASVTEHGEDVPLLALEAFLFAPMWDGVTQSVAPYGAIWQRHVGLARGRLHFLSVSFDLELRASADKDATEQMYDDVLNFTAAINAQAGGVGPALPSADGNWVWMHAQQALPLHATLGSLRAATFALVVLLLLSQNIVLTALATFASLCATLTLTALLVACQWALGSTEALLASITPALVAPPAALVLRTYAQSDAAKRSHRAAHAFVRGGAPVISGCVAMALGLAPLLACQLIDIFKFAVALSLIAFVVTFWIGIFLPALLGQIGPEPLAEGYPLQGSWRALVLRVCQRPGGGRPAPSDALGPGSWEWIKDWWRCMNVDPDAELMSDDLLGALAMRPVPTLAESGGLISWWRARSAHRRALASWEANQTEEAIAKAQRDKDEKARVHRDRVARRVAMEEFGGDETVIAQTHWRHAVSDVLSGRRKSKGGDDSARKEKTTGRDSTRRKSSTRGGAATPKKVAKRWQTSARRATVQAREAADETRFRGPAGDDAIDNEFLVAAVAQDLLGDTPGAKQLAESYARTLVLDA